MTSGIERVMCFYIEDSPLLIIIGLIGPVK